MARTIEQSSLVSKAEYGPRLLIHIVDERAAFTLACIKAGCQALFLYPRNSVEGQRKLLEWTHCHQVWYAASSWLLIEPWIRQRPVQMVEVPPPPEAWLNMPAEPFPYSRCFHDARWDSYSVLHISGSTGTPKPIFVRQGSLAIGDGFRNAPQY